MTNRELGGGRQPGAAGAGSFALRVDCGMPTPLELRRRNVAERRMTPLDVEVADVLHDGPACRFSGVEVLPMLST